MRFSSLELSEAVKRASEEVASPTPVVLMRNEGVAFDGTERPYMYAGVEVANCVVLVATSKKAAVEVPTEKLTLTLTKLDVAVPTFMPDPTKVDVALPAGLGNEQRVVEAARIFCLSVHVVTPLTLMWSLAISGLVTAPKLCFCSTTGVGTLTVLPPIQPAKAQSNTIAPAMIFLFML